MAGIKKTERGRLVKQDIWLNELIDDYLHGTMTPPRSGVFHPSTLSNTCDRAVWLTFHGKMPSTPLEPTLNRIFQNGNYLENRVESWFQNLGIILAREMPVKLDNPVMSGRIDFVIKHQEFGRIPVELKSINTSGFGKLKGPKEDHQLQLQMYLNMANPKFDIGTVLYENKNDQKIKSFLVERDEKQWDDILTRCFTIQEMKEAPIKCTGAPWCACKNVTIEGESYEF